MLIPITPTLRKSSRTQKVLPRRRPPKLRREPSLSAQPLGQQIKNHIQTSSRAIAENRSRHHLQVSICVVLGHSLSLADSASPIRFVTRPTEREDDANLDRSLAAYTAAAFPTRFYVTYGGFARPCQMFRTSAKRQGTRKKPTTINNSTFGVL